MPANSPTPVVQDVTQADRDAAAALTGEEAMAYGFADLSDAVQAFASHRLSTTHIPETDDYRRGIKAAAKVADGAVQLARDFIAKCEKWSPAQGEWSRARDLGLDIADAIRSLANQDKSNG